MSPQLVRDMEQQPLGAAAKAGYAAVDGTVDVESVAKAPSPLKKRVAIAVGALLIVGALAAVAFVSTGATTTESGENGVNVEWVNTGAAASLKVHWKKITYAPDINGKSNAAHLCQYECDGDHTCAGDLRCFQRSYGEEIPGCIDTDQNHKGWDYCYDPRVAGGVQIYPGSASQNDSGGRNYAACNKECDADYQCKSGLKCFQRSSGEPIPGCLYNGEPADWDYCYDPTIESKLTSSNWKTDVHYVGGYVFNSWQKAQRACKQHGYKTLCNKDHNPTYTRCSAGWWSYGAHSRSHYKGYYMSYGVSGCGSGVGWRGWSGSTIGAYCCGKFQCTFEVPGVGVSQIQTVSNMDTMASSNTGSCRAGSADHGQVCRILAQPNYHCNWNGAESATCLAGHMAAPSCMNLGYVSGSVSTRAQALQRCKDRGWYRLCSQNEIMGYAVCASGWLADNKGYWHYGASGCGSGRGFRGWGGAPSGAYCCDKSGCLDATACNYDSQAGRDDHSCWYPDRNDYQCSDRSRTNTLSAGRVSCLRDRDGNGVCDRHQDSLITYVGPYNVNSRSAAQAKCRARGFKGLCTHAEGRGYSSCAWGWWADGTVDFWYKKTQSGCGSGHGWRRGPSSTTAGVYCCHEYTCPRIYVRATAPANTGLVIANCNGGGSRGTHRCTFSCPTGYSGGGTITCGKNGQWPAHPQCTLRACPTLSNWKFHANAPAHTCARTNVLPTNAARCYLPNCNPGYRRTGNHYITCNTNGGWVTNPGLTQASCEPTYCPSFNVGRTWVAKSEWMHRAGGSCPRSGAWTGKVCTGLTACNHGYNLRRRAHELVPIRVSESTCTKKWYGSAACKTLHHITTSKEFIFSFDIKVTGTHNQWSSVLHLSPTGTFNGHQWRLPAVFQFANSRRLHVCMARKSKWNNCCNTPDLPHNKWVNVRVQLIGNTLSTHFNGEQQCANTEFGGNEKFAGKSNVRVYQGHKGYTSSPVVVKNVEYVRVTDGQVSCKTNTHWTTQTATPLCVDKNECANVPCKNFAKCENKPGSYVCHCTGQAVNFHGRHCETKHEDCPKASDKKAVAKQCGAHGTCANLERTAFGKKAFVCNCAAGFTKYGSGKMDPCDKEVPCQDIDRNSHSTGYGKCGCNTGYEPDPAKGGAMRATTTKPFYKGGCRPIKCDVPIIRGVKHYKSSKRSQCPTGTRSAGHLETCTIVKYPGFTCKSPGKCLPGKFQNKAMCKEHTCPRLAISAARTRAGVVRVCPKVYASVLSPRKTCDFKCQTGYDLVAKKGVAGKERLTCGPSGQWGYEAAPGQKHGKWGPKYYPYCKQRYCPKVVHRTASNEKPSIDCKRSGAAENKVCRSFRCESGWTLTGSTTVRCGTNGKWGAFPTCRLTRQCKRISIGVAGVRGRTTVSRSTRALCHGGSPFANQSCKFSCAPGFTMSGEATIKCNKATEGKWTKYPVCTENLCPAIRSTALKFRAAANCDPAFVTKRPVCTFSCQKGYSLPVGMQSISCDLNGKWQPHLKCEHTAPLTPPLKWKGEFSIGLSDKSGLLFTIKEDGNVRIDMNGNTLDRKAVGARDRNKCPGFPCGRILGDVTTGIPEMYFAYVKDGKEGGEWVPGTKGKVVVTTFVGGQRGPSGRTVPKLSNKLQVRTQVTPIKLPPGQVVTRKQLRAALDATKQCTAAQKAKVVATTTAVLKFKKGTANKGMIKATFKGKVCATATDVAKCQASVKVTVRTVGGQDVVAVSYTGTPNLEAPVGGKKSPPAVTVIGEVTKLLRPKPTSATQSVDVKITTTTTVKPGQVLPEEKSPADINKKIVETFENAGGATGFKVKTKPAAIGEQDLKIREQKMTIPLPGSTLNQQQVDSIIRSTQKSTGATDQTAKVSTKVSIDTHYPIKDSTKDQLLNKARQQLCDVFVDKAECEGRAKIAVKTTNIVHYKEVRNDFGKFKQIDQHYNPSSVCQGSEVKAFGAKMERHECTQKCFLENGARSTCCQFKRLEKGNGNRELGKLGLCTVYTGAPKAWVHRTSKAFEAFRMMKKDVVTIEVAGAPLMRDDRAKSQARLTRAREIYAEAGKRYSLSQTKLAAAVKSKDAAAIANAQRVLSANLIAKRNARAAVTRAAKALEDVIAAARRVKAAKDRNGGRVGSFKVNKLSKELQSLLSIGMKKRVGEVEGRVSPNVSQKFKVDVTSRTKPALPATTTPARTNAYVKNAFRAKGGNMNGVVIRTRPGTTTLGASPKRTQTVEVSGLTTGVQKRQAQAILNEAKKRTGSSTVHLGATLTIAGLKYPKGKADTNLIKKAVAFLCDTFQDKEECKRGIKVTTHTKGGYTYVDVQVKGMPNLAGKSTGTFVKSISRSSLPGVLNTPKTKVTLAVTAEAVPTLPKEKTNSQMQTDVFNDIKRQRKFGNSALPKKADLAVGKAVLHTKKVWQEETKIPIKLPTPQKEAITRRQMDAMFKEAKKVTHSTEQTMKARISLDLKYTTKPSEAAIRKDVEKLCNTFPDVLACRASIRIDIRPDVLDYLVKVTMVGTPRRDTSASTALRVLKKSDMTNSRPAECPRQEVTVVITSLAKAPSKDTLPTQTSTEKQRCKLNDEVLKAFTSKGGVVGGLSPAIKKPTIVKTPIFKGWMITPGVFKENGPTLMSTVKGKGFVSSPAFVVKRNTISFKTGYGSTTNSKGSTVSLYTDYLGPNQKLIHRHVPNGETRKYEVLWDVAGQMDEMVFLVITDGDDKSSIYFGDMRQFDNNAGCLPDVLQIHANQLCVQTPDSNGCFKLLGDKNLYEPVRLPTKKTPSGMYCRAGGKRLGENAGTKIRYPANSKISTVNIDITELPPCLYIEKINDHSYAIKTTNHGRRYLFDMLANHKNIKTPDTFSVYSTMTPRCAQTFGALRLTTRFKATCVAQEAQENCVGAYFDQFCDDGKALCGKGKVAQDVLKCCDSNQNKAGSACTGSSRRRLGENMRIASGGTVRTEDGNAADACADMCMKLADGNPHHPDSCVAWRLITKTDLKGRTTSTCMLATDCFIRPKEIDMRKLEEKEWFGFYAKNRGPPTSYSGTVNPFRGRKPKKIIGRKKK